MKTLNIITSCLAAGLFTGACSNEWSRHYEPDNDAASETVLEMVNSRDDLSIFGKMIEIAGCKELLSSSQTFTVFAPANSALTDVDLSDTESVKRIVTNHIARFNNSTSKGAAGDNGVKMYNGKKFHFVGMTFGGAEISECDMIATNGLLHVLSEQIPYKYNLREYISTHDDTRSMAEFLARFDQKKLDLDGSIAIGVDEKGQTVYDSLLVDYNPIYGDPIRGLGEIANEDSIFTMIIPTDAAWQRAYERISPYFNVYNENKAVADSIKDVQTSLAILGDLTYRGELTDAASLSMVLSTSGSKITNTAELFSGTTKIQASNGWIYTASELNYDNTLTWNKEIEVEGELSTGRTPGAGTTINVRTVESDNPLADEISEMSYIEVSSTSPSRQPGVTISIPDVLSGAYDIYASFVPATVSDATNVNDSTRVSFTVTYMGANGKAATKNFKESSFITSPTKMTLMKVADAMEFPVSNFYDRLWWADETHSAVNQNITTTVYVTTNVNNNEFNRNEMTRRFRLDRIIFVPIKN